MNGGQECSVHTHSQSELAQRESAEDEDAEEKCDGKENSGTEV